MKPQVFKHTYLIGVQEREVQLELKKERLAAQAERDQKSYEAERDALKGLEEEEQKAAVLRTRRKKEVQKYQLAQVKRKCELAAEQLLGEAITYLK